VNTTHSGYACGGRGGPAAVRGTGREGQQRKAEEAMQGKSTAKHNRGCSSCYFRGGKPSDASCCILCLILDATATQPSTMCACPSPAPPGEWRGGGPSPDLVRDGPGCSRDGGGVGEGERQHVAGLLGGGQHLHGAGRPAVSAVTLARAAASRQAGGSGTREQGPSGGGAFPQRSPPPSGRAPGSSPGPWLLVPGERCPARVS
jgi:hypothetical protein